MTKLGDAIINLKVNAEPSEELKAFIRAEVRKALQEEKAALLREFAQQVVQQTRMAYHPPRLEVK